MLRVLDPAILLQPCRFTVLVAPPRMAIAALNEYLPRLQRFLTLYVCGNYSRILSGIHRSCGSFDVQRAFTAYQLLTILEETHHSTIWVEYDSSLYTESDIEGLEEQVTRVLKDTGRNACIILYAPALDEIVARMAAAADRLICLEALEEKSTRGRTPRQGCSDRSMQKTLELF
jgi:hypothetical protein